MQVTVAPYLLSTCNLIQRAFADGIDSESYLALLKLLADDMSDRCLAQVIAEYTGKDYYVILNDIYGVQSNYSASQAITKVTERLITFGYEDWLKEDLDSYAGLTHCQQIIQGF